MSRASTSSQRTLTLTEELEKLEQSITLTLQEIDHNFNRAHRIVTTSILPIVEQYAEHSKNVWEGSKFWKQFFEASANVSLSGYEEVPAEDETVTAEEDTTQATPTSASYDSQRVEDPSEFTPAHDQASDRRDLTNNDSAIFESPTHSTPRARPAPSIAAYSSPYEALRREVIGVPEENSTSDLPSTPRQQTLSEQTPQSSPFLPPSTARQRTPADDVLLHRVLDKTYRIQATPHGQSRLPRPGTKPTQTPATGKRRPVRQDLDSSPLAEPELHAELFGSAVRTKRVPGVSVLTPAKKNNDKKRKIGDGNGEIPKPKMTIWDSDSDSDGGLPEGMSPPKTIHFHIPQSKLLQTPAREASKRIVEDLLLTAGGSVTDDLDEDSPSVVKRGGLLEEDTF